MAPPVQRSILHIRKDAHSNDRNLLKSRFLFKQRHEFQTVHIRKVQLEQDQVRVMLARFSQPPFPGHGDQRKQSGKENLLNQELGIVGLFLDNQYFVTRCVHYFLRPAPTNRRSNNYTQIYVEGVRG